MKSRKVTCTGCGNETGETKEQINSNPKPCPNCGSMEKTVHVAVSDTIKLDVKESLKGKIKDDRYRSKDKVRKKFFHGDDLYEKSGKWYKKIRVIDKEKVPYWYSEVVTDPETGEIFYECEEPLSEHRGHGSAKNDKKA